MGKQLTADAWVSAVERLPDDGAPVLCIFPDGRMAVCDCGPIVAAVGSDERIGTYWSHVEESGCSLAIAPTHWMLLPEPPHNHG